MGISDIVHRSIFSDQNIIFKTDSNPLLLYIDPWFTGKYHSGCKGNGAIKGIVNIQPQ